MKYIIDKKISVPAYIQLYDQLRQDIVSGNYAPGDKLPSKRFIAEEMGISVITVEHSLALLVDEGYAVSKERSGCFVSFGADMNPSLHRKISVHRNDSRGKKDFPFTVFAKTMRKVLSDYEDDILDPSPNNGCAELREALSAYLERSRGIHVNPERIIIGSGAEYLYGLVAQLLGRETLIALEDPSYNKIRKIYEVYGVRCEMLKLSDEGIVSSELESSKSSALHVTPYNSFPSGVTASAAKRYEYALWAVKNNRYIIEDDYDSEFSSALKQVSTIFSLAPENVIYINTFSRSIAPSLRVGYMLLPQELMGKYREELNFYSCTVPVYDQYVLAEFINSGEFERHINRMRRKLRSAAAE